MSKRAEALADRIIQGAQALAAYAEFFIEDHALRHSFHHLAKIQATLSA